MALSKSLELTPQSMVLISCWQRLVCGKQFDYLIQFLFRQIAPQCKL